MKLYVNYLLCPTDNRKVIFSQRNIQETENQEWNNFRIYSNCKSGTSKKAFHVLPFKIPLDI